MPVTIASKNGADLFMAFVFCVAPFQIVSVFDFVEFWSKPQGVIDQSYARRIVSSMNFGRPIDQRTQGELNHTFHFSE